MVFWLIVFIISLIVLVKGADWLIEKSEKIGLSFGLSPFIIGVIIVGIGTSLPELFSSSFAVFKGVMDVPVANAIGSNIANILLIVGASAVVSRRLTVTKNLIDLDLPLLAAATILFGITAWDQVITFGEALLMLLVYVAYIAYTLTERGEMPENHIDMLPSRLERRKSKSGRQKPTWKDYLMLALGAGGLVIGADYLIESLVQLASIFQIATGVIAVTAVALGTSLPELLVSIKAALKKKSELALGNIFGSNVFNILVVVGLPGLFKNLTIDNQTFSVGLPIMALATLLFVISGISRRIHLWEGIFYLGIYGLFIAKLFNWF